MYFKESKRCKVSSGERKESESTNNETEDFYG